MKATTLIFAVFCFTATAATSTGITVYIQKAPPPPKTEEPQLKPAETAVWTKGHWQWDGNRYVWQPGKWLENRKNQIRVDGHWEQSRHGYSWKPATWKHGIHAAEHPENPESE